MFKTLEKYQELLKLCAVEGFREQQRSGRLEVAQEAKHYMSKPRDHVSETNEDIGILREPILQVLLVEISRVIERRTWMPLLRRVARHVSDE